MWRKGDALGALNQISDLTEDRPAKEIGGLVAEIKGCALRERETRGISVGIVCENEILKFGLGAALHGQGAVARVHEIPPGHPDPADGVLRSLDVVVLSYAEWETASRFAAAARTAGVRVLAVVDETVRWEPEKLVLLRPDGFIMLRELTAAGLEDALLKVSRSEPVMSPGALSGVFDSMACALRRSHPGHVELTDRERETLELMADGLSNKEIAKKLAISLHGVKRLVGNILLKLNSPNRTQAVVLAMRSGLVRKP